MYANAAKAISYRFTQNFKNAEKCGHRFITIGETGSKIVWFYDKTLRMWTIITFGPSPSVVTDGRVNGLDQINEAQYTPTKATLKEEVHTAVVDEIVRVTQLLISNEVTTAWLCDNYNNELLPDNDEDSEEVKAEWWLRNLLRLVGQVAPKADFAKQSKVLNLMDNTSEHLKRATGKRDKCANEFKSALAFVEDAHQLAQDLSTAVNWHGCDLQQHTATVHVLRKFKRLLAGCIDAQNWDGVTGLCKDGLAAGAFSLAREGDEEMEKEAARIVMEMSGQYLGVEVVHWTADCCDQYSDNGKGFHI